MPDGAEAGRSSARARSGQSTMRANVTKTSEVAPAKAPAEPDAAAPGRTRDSRIDQFDACVLKSGNQFHQRIDVGPDDAVAGLHALNGRN